jgi:hypothetical protein
MAFEGWELFALILHSAEFRVSECDEPWFTNDDIFLLFMLRIMYNWIENEYNCSTYVYTHHYIMKVVSHVSYKKGSAVGWRTFDVLFVSRYNILYKL